MHILELQRGGRGRRGVGARRGPGHLGEGAREEEGGAEGAEQRQQQSQEAQQSLLDEEAPLQVVPVRGQKLLPGLLRRHRLDNWELGVARSAGRRRRAGLSASRAANKLDLPSGLACHCPVRRLLVVINSIHLKLCSPTALLFL